MNFGKCIVECNCFRLFREVSRRLCDGRQGKSRIYIFCKGKSGEADLYVTCMISENGYFPFCVTL